MFFQHKILSIKAGDKVLEIGPGATPHPRANTFLEYRFLDENEAIEQRGDIKASPNFQGRPVIYYSGEKFPFNDGEFDYVIASHVLEHVPNPEVFMSEIYRVGGGRGYLEFPLPPYEYLFNFDVHTQFVWFDLQECVIKYLPKRKTALSQFNSISSEMRTALELGWDDLVSNNLEHFFIGFEYESPVSIIEQKDLSQYDSKWQQNGNTLSRRLIRKFSRLIKLLGLGRS
ncbi:class I SAM-dependent methyltransferase [Polynucleobacter sp. JS-JIR-II-b4]|jgi:SAM-dependent methyltransferase|uniref:class I SAM-dependent methyltransferase n=1 Tax=Polynucleobacter sp. JS-JIR-II-b4 TaxID=1758390 RepID=UPI001BFE4444|nr:class I SAM-dependent methyltransferase [Polynucleobacter sp. JS-JIR-II-b4]QWE02826.1 methyltransferase domain-containing protein [Polynucleobacter sp. JS-JIR-II-b4]